jgi:Holliday junction resolvase RusA-like endonuclease
MSSAPPSIILQLPPPPSTNRLWSTPPGRRRRIRTPEYSRWLVEAGWEARRQLVAAPTILGAFDASVTVPIGSRRDRDNWSKPIFDLCQAVGAVVNDSGLRDYVVLAADRADVLVLLWDKGGPPIKPAKILPVTLPHSRPGKLTLKALQIAARRVLG